MCLSSQDTPSSLPRFRVNHYPRFVFPIPITFLNIDLTYMKIFCIFETVFTLYHMEHIILQFAFAFFLMNLALKYSLKIHVL